MKNAATLCFLLVVSSAFAQPQSREGMAPKTRNYTTFEPGAARHVSFEMDARTPEEFKKNPDYGWLPYNTQCADCYELIAERTATTRLFVKNNTRGTIIYSQAGAQPINYKDAGGNWRAIDPRVHGTETPGLYAALQQPSPTFIDLQNKLVSVRNGNAVLSFNRNLKLWHSQEGAAPQLVAAANWSKATVGSDGARVQDIFPGIDLVVYSIQGGLKSSFVINSKLSYQDGFLLLEDEMELPAGTSLTMASVTTPGEAYQGMITVRENASGASLYEIGTATGFDNSNKRENEKLLGYRLNGNKLAIAVPISWMNNPSMVYPVTIDPLVTSTGTYLQANITGSGGNGSGSFVPASACPYNLTVPVPANCTVTDIRFAFDYIAQNGAWMSEGATDFLYGTCRSPSNSSLYWYCNSNSAGTCTTGVAGISIYSDFQSCIPAPQCASYNMNFTMRFYDRWGTTCSNTWIGANSNWVMTVEGNTVEYTNTSTPISVSSTNICANQSIVASTSVQYGVPAYSVNWSFNSSGTPSVGSGTSTNISFPGPGTYTLYGIATDACAQTTSASTVITVNALPTPTITPTANPVCQGQTTTLNASGATTYTWSANAGGGTGSSATVTPPLGATVYTVTGTASGCSGSATTTVTVNALPSVAASASPATLCSGQNSTLTASGANTYTWSANAGGSTSNPTVITATASTTYSVTGTDNNGCTNTTQLSVTVTPSPTLNVSASPATICTGQTATLSVSGATSYTWSTSGTASTETVAPASTTSYTVIGDNGGACTATQNVTVNVTPLPLLTITATPVNICSGQSTTLTASGASTYTWSPNSGGGTSNPVTVSPSSTSTYTVAGTQSGCSDSTTITVNVGAPPVVSASASDTTICNGQSTTLTGTGATSYTWSPGGTGSSINASPSTTTTYTLIGDNGGCADTTSFVVTVNPTPTVSAAASPATICSGQTSTLTAGGAPSYTWSANAGGGTSAIVSVTPGTTTTYTVTGDTLGCTASQVVTVSVTPTPTVTASAASATVCSGQGTTLSGSGASSYTWSANAGSVTTQTAGVSPVNNPETYTVTGANGSCTASATVSVGVVTTPTVVVAPVTSTLCAGETDTLIANATAGSTISWLPGGSPNDSLIVSPSASTTYTVTASNGACTDTETISVTVNAAPTLSAVSSQTACSGGGVSAVNFSGTGTGVNWTNTNTNVGIGASGSGNIGGYAAPVVSSTEAGVITATPVDSITGCIGSSQTFTIVINPGPSITGGTPDSALCGAPTGGVSGVNVTGGTQPYTYQWYSSGGSVGGATSANLANQPVGTYSLEVTDANGCVASSAGFAVPGTPSVTAAFAATPTTGIAPLNVAFSNASAGASGYSWNFGNGGTSTGQDPATTYSTGGTYVVTLTASNGSCVSTYTLTIFVDQAISLVVPNVFSPNGDNVNDQFTFVASGITQLTCDIYNRWGQKVKTLSSATDTWDGKLSNGNDAAQGTYYYMVTATSFDGKEHNSEGYITIVR